MDTVPEQGNRIPRWQLIEEQTRRRREQIDHQPTRYRTTSHTITI
jgi:hypothetical protein